MSRMTWTLILGVAIVLAVLAWQVWPSDDAPSVEDPDVAATGLAPDSPYWTSADRWVDVDGVRARVRIEGDASAPVIVLIHGFSDLGQVIGDGTADDAAANDYHFRIVR